jgi:hypothetical protein
MKLKEHWEGKKAFNILGRWIMIILAVNTSNRVFKYGLCVLYNNNLIILLKTNYHCQIKKEQQA